MYEELIPISMFVGLTVVFCLFFWFRYRGRAETQTTLRTALDKGQELTPEIIDRLGHPKPPRNKDLRLALIWMAIALATAVMGFSLPDASGQSRYIFLGIGSFPFFLGLAYLVLWLVPERNS